jgi:hypothetical protein
MEITLIRVVLFWLPSSSFATSRRIWRTCTMRISLFLLTLEADQGWSSMT